MDFQTLIFTLQKYWSDQGCLILQPLDQAVGAGTFHPETFLSAIGPEQARSSYVQASRRPSDGRYGDNPNRLQRYFQFQVMMKPSPDDFQNMYLDSLKAIGVDMLKNDVRFVEDNWESPTLGAWGLGWEVWLNGLEISQFTYFQQVGGLPCEPVTGEITYGLERIAMHLNEVNSVYDLVWSNTGGDNMTYGQLFHQNEKEQSKYNFELADVASLFLDFDQAEKMCNLLLQQQLSLPAYEQVLAASHIFNLLDARHAVSVTERARYIQRVRALATGVAEVYLSVRKQMGFPRGIQK